MIKGRSHSPGQEANVINGSLFTKERIYQKQLEMKVQGLNMILDMGVCSK